MQLIAKTVNAEIARDQLPGAVLAIARRGKLVYVETFGYRDKAAAQVSRLRTGSVHRLRFR